jgi:HK97 family phage prohead protease
MPYFITETNPECSGWAVVDEGNGYYGCHTTKQSAIDQAIAISISTEEPFEGERAAIDSLVIGDYVSYDVLNPTILAQVVAVEGEMAVIQLFEYEDGIFKISDKLMIINVFKIDKVRKPEMIAVELEDEPSSEEEQGNLPDNYRPALSEDVPEGRACGNCFFFDESRINEDGDKAWCERWDAFVEGGNYCNAWQANEPTEDSPTMARAKAILARIKDKESESMTDVMDQGRAKWLKVAYAIKAKLEGTEDTRALGKNETRTNHIELRAEGDGRSFTGYAALFNEPSLPLPFTEYIRPGAFKRSLQSRNRMMLLWNHDTSNPLASTRNGSLQMVEDQRGLKVTATLPDTTLGRDISELVRTGVVDSMSFGFSVKRDTWSQDGQTRYLEDVTLWEVSLVSSPAYEQTAGTVSVRSDISADALADALLKIESGEELEPEQGALINEVIGKLTKTPEVEEVDGDILALKQKKLALLMMGI